MPTIGKHYDLDTDNTLSNNSDNVIASQKATKEYVDNNYVPQSMLEEAATVAKTGSYNDLTDKPTIPTVNNKTITIQKNSTTVDSFTLNQSTDKTINISVPTTASDVGAQVAGNYISYTNNTATVAGTSKTVSKTNPETLFVPNGLIMGGTAAAAGLVTRGVCGVSSPDSTTGAATKDNLYINYDSTNTYNSSRQVVIQAGSVGTHYGNNLYQYAAARGDAVKNYADATYTPLTRKVNNKALSSDITLTASDVSAVASNTAITGATKCKITYDSKGLVTAGADLQASDIPDLSSTYLTSHQSIKSIKSDNTTAQSTSSSEAVAGSGTINLHKIAKTGTFSDLLSKPTSISGYGITDAYTKTEVDGLISSVYKPAGSVAFASLPTLASGVLGNVYNVTDAFTTTTDFVEGSGKSYPAGTNVVVVEPTSGTYKFDVLAGFVDLSGYVPTARKVNNKALSADITLTASDVGAISSHQSIKSLKTDNTTTQSTSSSEAIAGSGSISLHKVSKTGSYSDLLNKPTIPATNTIPATTTANKVLLSTTTSGTAKWSDFSSAGLLKTNTSGVVSVDTTSYGTYSKPSGGIPSTDLAESYYLASNPNGYTSNAGTVTSVRVQAGTGLSSSTSTAQNTTLNTTISIASGYKLPTTTEWGNKQDALTTQTAYTSKGSATKVPQITTNTLGQVTGITEVDITHPTELPSQTGQSGKFLTTNGSTVSWANASTSIDNSTITKNGSDQIQTVGYKDVRTNNTLKTWTGTKAQYDAIVTKDANTLYNITDDTDTTLTVLNTLYPIGSIYIGTMDICPLVTLGVGSWELQTSRFLVDKKEPTANDPSWYNLYSDGWCEQGGFATAAGFIEFTYPYNSSNFKFSFNRHYPEATSAGSSSTSTANHNTVARSTQYGSTTGAGVYIAINTENGCDGDTWIAWGYTSVTSSIKMWRRTS